MKKNVLFTIVFFAISSLFLALCYYIVQKERTMLSIIIDNDFYSSVNIEMERRLKESGIPFHFSLLPSASIDSDTMIYQTEEATLHIEKDSTYSNKDATQRQNQIIQTFLLEEGHPLDIQTLDSIFTDKLSQKSYPVITGIRYINMQTGDIQESKPGHLVYSAFPTQLLALGILGEINVQGFYTLTSYPIIRKTPLPFILLFIAWIICIAGFSFLIFRKKEKLETTYIHISETKKSDDISPLIKINDSIYFDPTKSEIYYEDQAIHLSPQADTLFKSFLEDADYYLANEKIDPLLWESRNETRTVRSKAIQRLRDVLEPIPIIKIENVNRKGYRLKIREE